MANRDTKTDEAFGGAVSAVEAKAELSWRSYQADICWSARNTWRIEHPKGERWFAIREPQQHALLLWDQGANSITLKARQIGWSTTVSFYAARLAQIFPNTKILFLSKGERESKMLLEKVKFGIQRQPDWLQAKAPKVTRENMETIEWSNGSSITSLPSRNNPARGFTGKLVVVDEWAFLDNGDEAWASIEPVTDIGGQVIGLSTANGVGNTFHDLWLRAQSGESSFQPMFYSWRAVPERDDAWYEAKKHDMQVWQLHQEYPTTPEEAFIKSGAMVFDGDVLDYLKEHHVQPFKQRGTLTLRGGDWRLIADDIGGALRVWERPVGNGLYVLGADVAEGLKHGDWSTATVLRVETDDNGEVGWRAVAFYRYHADPDVFGETCALLGRWYNDALIGIEANNHGLAANNAVRDDNYPRQYREKKVDHRQNVKTDRLGWWTDKKSKAVLIDDLRTALREGLWMPDQGTLDELYTFVYDGRGGMNGSPHDDRVISIGIAVQMAQLVHNTEYAPEKSDEFTMDWWLRGGDMLKKPDPQFLIGGHR